MNHFDYCAQFIIPSDSILDVGSGRGEFLMEMVKRGFDVYGLEINPEYIYKSKKRAAELALNPHIIEGSGEAIPFSDNYFSFVNCAEVTEHVNDPTKVCREIYRVLGSHGKGYVSFHNRFGFFDYHYHLPFINWLPRLLAQKMLEFVGREKEDGANGLQRLSTMHYYTYGQVRHLLEEIGFKVVDTREEKIKNEFGAFSWLVLFFYKLLARPFYFNSFHMIVEK